MTSTAVLRTPPASTCASDYVSLRPHRGGKERDFRRDNSPSPTASLLNHRVKSPPDRSFVDSPTQPSPSPLRKRVLFERGSTAQCDSDDDDDPSPSVNRLHSPFASRCASPFLGAWGSHGSKILPSAQPIEDDEGLFLTSKTLTTPTRTPTRPSLTHNGPASNHQTLTAGMSAFPTLILTPPPPKKQLFPVLSPLQPPQFLARAPQTPAETDWHLGRQAESMTKLSLGDDEGHYKGRNNSAGNLNKEEPSPSLASKRRGRKRSVDGNELWRSRDGIFETSTDMPPAVPFQVPESPSPVTRLKSSATSFFGPSILSSPGSVAKPLHLGVTTKGFKGTLSRSSSPNPSVGPIAKKYRPRDSGVGGLDDEDETEDGLGPLAPARDIGPLTEESSGFVTPGAEPLNRSAWPRAVFAESQQGEVDEFIFKTLAAGGAAPKEKKVMPGTPVKRNAYAHSRPWRSSSKAMPPPVMPRGGAPRKSLPLSFPNLSQIQDSPDGSDTSPSSRQFPHRKMYGDVGKGRPDQLLSRGGGERLVDTKMELLVRRSSSGTFSSSSSSDGSLIGTPTKPNILEGRLPGVSPKITLSSSMQPSTLPTSETPMKRPAFNRHNIYEHHHRPSPRPSFAVLQRPLTQHELPGRFEADFVTVDSIGTGEFGKALKVRYKRGDESELFAIKKSKRFEGMKHRQRLREEVDVLKHLALAGGQRSHPNVLKYVDSWEQDDVLYIQTELCELGNFGTFLAEYGMHFEALDEARVWKICAELSNGLKFIHAAGVIHLDLKPANIFVTGEGRFKIGDFGMASLWPRCTGDDGFEREGDREYMAPEVLQGRYGKGADVFSFGMIMLETAANIVVPDMGEDWHRLREDDLSAVDFVTSERNSLAHPRSTELIELIMHMMRSNPDARLTAEQVYAHTVVQRAREAMAHKLAVARESGAPVFGASPLGGEPENYVEDVLQLGRTVVNEMDLSP